MTCYRFIAVEAAHPAVTLLCRMMSVSRSGYYAWRARGPSAQARGAKDLAACIHQVHAASRGTYGSPRVHAELRAAGGCCARKRVARLMRAAGLRGCHGQRRHPRTTVPARQAAPASDRGERRFMPAQIGAPDRLWGAAISYGATLEGWLYLAVVLDALSRKVIGWAMAAHLRTELVGASLAMALRNRRPAVGLIHHSDHGCQDTALAFGHQLQEAGIVASMGSVGDCYDNAVAESFFATLKVELLHRQTWPTRAEARRALFESMEVWDNRQRRHSTLGYCAPCAYEEAYWQAAVA